MKQYEKKTENKVVWRFLLSVVIISLVILNGSIIGEAAANTAGEMAVYQGVTISPDGTAWTTDYMDKTNESLPEGFTIETGQTSNLRALNEGEHYYQEEAEGSIRIGKWVVAWKDAQCIHYFEAQNYKGFQTTEGICESYYNNGWNAYCAECNELIADMYIYAKSDTVQGILTMPAKSCYLYLCPQCHGLEQGREYQHICKKISYNRYEISYEKNTPANAEVTGYMAVTRHMYNNAAIYEGASADKIGYSDTKLRKNSYECDGYIFNGWNTEPDGSGEGFSDGQRVINVSSEEGATIRLYAQWKCAESTLLIDANGGTYNGKNKYLVTQGCRTTYQIDNDNLMPAPGYTISFETNGGSEVEDIVTNKLFSHWELQGEWQGDFKGNVYTFPQMEGNIDTIKAQYTDASFILPDSKKENEALVGWYKDAACTDEGFVGTPGECVSMSGDMILYAKWARLTLWALDDYVSHEGVGAVDLTWEQKDGQGKFYKIYQSSDKEAWKNIYIGENNQEVSAISEYLGTDMQGGQYIVEHTGYYKITAAGAKGADYDDTYIGGNGGSVTAEYWLEKGDILICYAGTSGDGMTGGFNGSEATGGNSLTDVGRGGGAGTELYLTRNGETVPLLIAGGGGGANESHAGGEGGAMLSELESMAGATSNVGGGGGGAQGGSGNDTYYQTTLDAPNYEDIAFKSEWTTVFPEATQVYSVWKKPKSNSLYPTQYLDISLQGKYITNPEIIVGDLNRKVSVYQTDATNGEYHYKDTIVEQAGVNTPLSYDCFQSEGGFVRKYEADYPVNGNTNIVVSGILDAWGAGAIYGSIRFRIIDADKEVVLHDETYVDGSAGVTSSDNTAVWIVGAWGNFDVKGIENVRVEVWIYVNSYMAHVNTKVMDTFFYGRTIGVDAGTAGGTSYINTSFGCKNEVCTAGTNSKDGFIQIESMSIGYIDNTNLDDVLAKDTAAPGVIEQYTISMADENNLMVTLTQPEDFGTVYYHKAESYYLENNGPEHIATSNITANILKTGVIEYYYYIDTEPEGMVTENHAGTRSEKIPVTMTDETLYLHVAAVDAAGNLGETADIELQAEINYPTDDTYPENKKLFTEQLKVEDTEYVYPADEKTYFVKADGITEHILCVVAGLDGAAASDFQIDYLRFNIQNEIHEEWMQTLIPHSDIVYSHEVFTNERLNMSMSEDELVLLHPGIALAERKNHAAVIDLSQCFSVKESTPEFQIYPSAIACFKDKVYYSEDEKDVLNGVKIIPDGEPPVILGLEELQNINVLDMTEQSRQFVLWAEDNLSGLQEFTVYIHNKDNHMKEEFACDSEGKVEVEISKDNPLFIGDITISAIAVDNVSNATVIGEDGLTFTLETNLYRERNPEETIFKTGDGAVLEIFTSGYVERVEVIFPEELLKVNPDLNCVFEYENPSLRKSEMLKFSIPLGIPEREYEVTVKAYKKGQMLVSKPAMMVVEGNVLDELRTRIRNNG